MPEELGVREWGDWTRPTDTGLTDEEIHTLVSDIKALLITSVSDCFDWEAVQRHQTRGQKRTTLFLFLLAGVEKGTRKACLREISRKGGGKDEPDEGARTSDSGGGGTQRGVEAAGGGHGEVDVCDDRSKSCHDAGLKMPHSHDGSRHERDVTEPFVLPKKSGEVLHSGESKCGGRRMVV